MLQNTIFCFFIHAKWQFLLTKTAFICCIYNKKLNYYWIIRMPNHLQWAYLLEKHMLTKCSHFHKVKYHTICFFNVFTCFKVVFLTDLFIIIMFKCYTLSISTIFNLFFPWIRCKTVKFSAIMPKYEQIIWFYQEECQPLIIFFA